MEPGGLPGSWQSVSADALAAEFGVKPIWVVVPGAQRFNTMAQHMYGLRQPQAALRWLELAMAGDQRRHTPEFAAISSLHLATILHGLSRHLAALDVLEGAYSLLTDRAVTAGGTHEDHNHPLLLAVCLHNMGVAQLILGASEAAAASCVRAIETTRAYWMKTAQRRGRRPADSDELAVAAAQMEVTWLAVMRVAGGQRQQQPVQRSALRDSRRSLLLLASRHKRKCGDRPSRLEDRQRKTQSQSKEDRAQALVSANLRRIQHSTRGQDRRNG